MTENLTPAQPSASTDGAGLPARLWRGFTRFRRTRPFWGAVILAWAAYMIGNPLFGTDFAFYANVGARSIAPALISIGMFAAAGVAVVAPGQRHFPAIVASMLAVAALPLANLGGLVIGTVAGIVGSGMVFAWTPYTDKQLARFAAKAERKAARRAAKHALRTGGGQPVAG